ncbi:MAG: SDR family oxidoreductase [Betaproteobacteria bacterium]|nr:SDR family oxidoreductase [Betaproteobacteria bacterium]
MNPVLLITGGGRGIGAAVARLAAAQGWDVALNAVRDMASAQAVAAEVQALGRRALAVQADVSDEAAVQALFTRVDAELGPLRGLVNNAGVVDIAQRVDQMSLGRWQRMFAINVQGTFLCTREALRRMSTQHGGTGGAREVAHEGVRVNAVRPGIIDTDIHASGGQPDRVQRMAPQVPMQRAGTAEEVARAVVWLLSDQASYTTGSVLDVAGGR